MADFTLKAAPVLGGVDQTIGANRIQERDDLALVSVATPLGEEAALATALKDGWRLAMPTPTQSTQSGTMRALRSTADQILLLFPHNGPDAEAQIQAKLQGAGYTTDQTDAWVILEISGPQTLAALERLSPIDVATAPDGTAARTVMEHMGVFFVRLAADRVLLMSASSSARSFLHAVETSYHNVVA